MTVDWLTQIVTIPQGDLTLVSGTFYTGATNALRILIKTEEASETGIVFPDITQHNTEVGPIAGVTYARTIEIINGYTLSFSPDSNWSVQLEGSNNNMWDIGGGILNQNQVQVIPTNSAGLITVTSGSGITAQDKLDIADRVWDELTSTHTTAGTTGEALVDAVAGGNPWGTILDGNNTPGTFGYLLQTTFVGYFNSIINKLQTTLFSSKGKQPNQK